MPRSSRRCAFTRVEFVVVCVIIAVAVAVFIMVIPRAGTAAHKNTCRNNQRLLGIALANHLDAYKVFPPLYFSNDPVLKQKPPLSPLDAAGTYSWQTRLLPYLEQAALHKQIAAQSQNFVLPSSGIKLANAAGEGSLSPRELQVKQLRCPAVPDSVSAGNGNYVATSATRLPLLLELNDVEKGNPHFMIEPDGMLIPDHQLHGISERRMSDGTSKTILVIESREPTRSDWFDPQQSFVVGFLPADSTPIDAERSNFYPYFGPEWTFNPKAGNRTALNFGPTRENPKSAYNETQDALARTWGPSSGHEGGVVFAVLGDQSVQEVSSDVDPKVFFAAITAHGGETVPNLPPPELP